MTENRDWREDQADREALVAAAIERYEIRGKAVRGIPMNTREWNGLRELDPELYEKAVEKWLGIARNIVDDPAGPPSLLGLAMVEKNLPNLIRRGEMKPDAGEVILWVRQLLIHNIGEAWRRWRALERGTVAAGVEFDRVKKMIGYELLGTIGKDDGVVRILGRKVPACVHDKVKEIETQRSAAGENCGAPPRLSVVCE